MDCALTALHALLACFSWSNLYLDGAVEARDAGDQRYEWQTTVNHEGNAIETVTQQVLVDDPYNPYGRISLGYQFEFKSMTLAVEASHESSLDKNDDRGVNSIGIRARWYPFRR